MEMVHDRCSTLLTGFSTALTTILPILFQYCYKCCYSDSRNLWTVMKAEKHSYVTHRQKKSLSLSLYIFTLRTSIVHHCLCRDGIYFDKILVSEYKLFKRSNKAYDKRNDFNFKIINCSNMCSYIQASPAYGVYISQLIRYARASSNYSDFLKRHLHLRDRLLVPYSVT
jgi:hypothetical protein